MVQWLGLHAPNAGGPGSIPGQETGSHMPKQRLKIPQAETKTQHSQKIKKKYPRESCCRPSRNISLCSGERTGFH